MQHTPPSRANQWESHCFQEPHSALLKGNVLVQVLVVICEHPAYPVFNATLSRPAMNSVLPENASFVRFSSTYSTSTTDYLHTDRILGIITLLSIYRYSWPIAKPLSRKISSNHYSGQYRILYLVLHFMLFARQASIRKGDARARSVPA